MRKLLIIALLLSGICAQAQTDPVPDSVVTVTTSGNQVFMDTSALRLEDSEVLTFDEYYRLVLRNHPIVNQANLLPQQAAQEIRLARGAFDPKLEGKWDFKDYKETEYYNILDVGLKAETNTPVNPKVGFMQNSGQFLNPENFISDRQQVYAGVSVQLGRGLIIDTRQATLQQAQLFVGLAEADQIKEINKILLTAAKDYWEWYYAYQNLLLMEQSIVIAQDIFRRTRQGFAYGEASAIDTVQAEITLQNRLVEYDQAKISYIRAALQLSNHLWNSNGDPLQLKPGVIPQLIVTEEMDRLAIMQMIDTARVNHPELLKLRIKREVLEVDLRLARENLKPQLDLSYTLLDQPFTAEGEEAGFDFGTNYKLSVDFSFPLFLRKERAKLSMTRFKIQDNNLELDFRERELINEINKSYNTVLTTRRLIARMRDMVDNYERIIQAERLNLQYGESDLFKFNLQLDKLIESQSKLLKMKATYQKSIAELYWAAGITNLGRTQ